MDKPMIAWSRGVGGLGSLGSGRRCTATSWILDAGARRPSGLAMTSHRPTDLSEQDGGLRGTSTVTTSPGRWRNSSDGGSAVVSEAIGEIEP
jgi:hypothetical protein